MSFRLQGPFPLDLQAVGASVRVALGQARAAMGERDFAARLRAMEGTGATPGLYLLWDDPAGGGASAAPSVAGFWLTFGPSYVEGGPQEPLDRHPPFGQPILDALTEEVWWQGLRVVPRDPDPRWRPLFVFEWPSDLANRSACPPPGVPTDQNDENHIEKEPGGDWLALEDFEEQATVLARNLPDPGPAGPARAPIEPRSLIAVIQGDLRLQGNQHAASYALVHLPEDLGAGPGGVHLPAWMDHAFGGGSAPPEDDYQAAGVPLRLPGDRVGYALGGWLTAALDVFPQRPSACETGVLLGRDVGSRWKVQARTTASVVTTVVVMVLALAALVQEFTRPRAHAGPAAPATEAQPALSVCSVDNEQFVQELRCQIQQAGDNLPLDQRACGDRAKEGETRDRRVQPISADLQATWCGLRDRDLDERRPFGMPEEARPEQVKVREPLRHGGYADLVAARSCYNVLQHPEDYRLDPAEPDLYHLPNPDRFLEDPVYEVKALGELVRELDRACDAFRPRLERQVEGAVLATHVGAAAEPARAVDRTLPEAAQLRQFALIKATEALPPTERICLNDGASNGPYAASGYGDLCTGAAAPATGSAWDRLARDDLEDLLGAPAEAGPDPLAALVATPNPEDPQVPAPGETLVDRYVMARYSPFNHPSEAYEQVVQGASDLWKCHMALADPKLPMPMAGGTGYIDGSVSVRWDLTAPVPSSYPDRSAGAVTRQLELDAVLSDLEGGGPDLGACWPVVARRLVRYRPVHPLLPEREVLPWPSEEQQLCAQVCAVLYRVRQSPHRDDWYTRGTDLGRCVDRRGPDSLTRSASGAAFSALRLPWNFTRDKQWEEPYPFEICAFNLVAEDYLSGDIGEVISDGTPAPRWAGETIDYRTTRGKGETLAGGVDLRKLGYDRPNQQLPWVSSEPGAAWEAAMNLESYGRARSSSTCGHAATQCFVSQMVASISSNPDQPHRWMAAWQTRMTRLASGDGTDDLDRALEATEKERIRLAQQAENADAERSYGNERARATPWCRLIQPYMAGDGGLPEGQLDFPCASGVEKTRQQVEGVLQQLAGSGRTVAQGTP